MSEEEKSLETEAQELAPEVADEQQAAEAPDAAADEAQGGETAGNAEKPGETPEEPPAPDYEAELAKLNDKYLRVCAEYANYKRRMAREFAENRERARQNTVSEFLSVYDYFQMAMAHFERGGDLEAVKQGMQMIVQEFQKTFDNLGVKEIETVGKDFDPNFHEAVAREVTTEMEEGKVLRQWKPGFLMGDKLLRAATVVVAVRPPAEAPADGAASASAGGSDGASGGLD